MFGLIKLLLAGAVLILAVLLLPGSPTALRQDVLEFTDRFDLGDTLNAWVDRLLIVSRPAAPPSPERIEKIAAKACPLEDRLRRCLTAKINGQAPDGGIDSLCSDLAAIHRATIVGDKRPSSLGDPKPDAEQAEPMVAAVGRPGKTAAAAPIETPSELPPTTRTSDKSPEQEVPATGRTAPIADAPSTSTADARIELETRNDLEATIRTALEIINRNRPRNQNDPKVDR